MNWIRGRLATQDEGATLILVLVLISMIGLMSVAVLNLSDTSLRSAAVTQEVAEEQYDEEAAMSAGVQNIQEQIFQTRYRDVGSSNTRNTSGTPVVRGLDCDPSQLTGPNLASGYVTSCERDPEANEYTVNTPQNAVMSLGSAAQDGGLGIHLVDTGRLAINGEVYSKSGITNTGNQMLVNGYIEPQTALPGGCAGDIVSTRPNGAVNCRAASPIQNDPGYSWPSANTTLTKADLPAISCAGDTVTFSPGYYGSAAALNAIFSNATCQSKALYFQPGDYFFDFKDGQSPATAGDEPIWNISDSDIRMVAGQQNPTYWSPTPSAANVYRACNAPTTSGQTGANFIFGGRSQLNITAGHVAICGSYINTVAQQQNEPPLPVFGANANIGTLTATGPTSRYSDTQTAVNSGNSCTTGFSNPTRAEFWQSANTATATATLNGANGVAGSRRCMRVTDFSLPSEIPAGSVVVNASVMVRAGTNNTNTSNKLIDLIVDGTGSAAAGSAAFTQTTTSSVVLPSIPNNNNTTSWTATAVQTFDVTSALYDDVYNEGLSDLSILLRAWKSAGGANFTVAVDTIQLAIQWITPNVADQSTLSYGASGVNGYGVWSSASGTRNLSIPFHTTAVATASGNQVIPASGSVANFSTSNNNCVAQTNYPTTGCAFLRTANNNDVDFHVRGGIYAPSAAIDIRHTGISDAPVVSNGVVARKVYLSGTALNPAYRNAGGVIFGVGWPTSVSTYNWTFRCSGACGSIGRATAGYPNLASIMRTQVGTSQTTFANGPHEYVGVGRDTTTSSWQFANPVNAPGLSVQTEITSDWGAGFCADVTVSTSSSTPITWLVDVDLTTYPLNAVNITSGSNFTNDGFVDGILTASGVGWNDSVDVNNPRTFSLCADRAPAPPAPAEYSYTIDNDWGSGYCATIEVTTESPTPIAWEVEVDMSQAPLDGTPSSVWNATWSFNAFTLTASGVGWNDEISVNNPTSFGFCANRP